MKTKICPKCQEDNPSEAKICWSCYTPLDGEKLELTHAAPMHKVELEPSRTASSDPEFHFPGNDSKICPKCREENPSEAVMCWACYTPLSGFNPSPIQVNAEIPEFTFPQTKWWLDKADIVWPPLLLIGLISSGWWRGKTRFWVSGTLIGIIAVISAWQKREEIRKRRLSPKVDHRDLESPICRIASTILHYAVNDGASQVRISLYPRGIRVEYLIKDEWHEQMKIPQYVWRPLKNELEIRAGSGTIECVQGERKAHFQLRILIEPPKEEILLTLLEKS